MDDIYRDDLSTIAKGAGITFFGKIVSGIIQYLYLILLARSLGAKSLGLLAVGFIVIDFIGIIARFGLEGAVVKFVAAYNGENEKGKIKGMILNSLLISLILSIIMAFLILLFPTSGLTLFGNINNLDMIVKILSLSIPFYSLMIILLYSTQGFKNMSYAVYGQNIILPVVNMLMFLLLYYWGFGVESAAWSYVVATVVGFVFSVFCLKKVFPGMSHVVPVYQTRQLTSFSFPILILYIAIYLILWTDILMLSHYRSNAEVGIYNAAVKTVVLIKMVITSFVPIFSPIISDLYNKKESKRLESLYKTANRWTFTISLPIFLLALLLSREIMLVFGKDFTGASTVLVILGFAQLVDAGTGLAMVILNMSGKEKLMMYNSIGVGLFAVLINYLLVPTYGLTGAAIANLSTFVVLDFLLMGQIYLIQGIHPYSKKFVNPILCGVVSFFICLVLNWLLSPLGMYYKSGLIILTFIAIFIIALRIMGMDEDDNYLIGVIKHKFIKAIA